ncbi:hypothetical protein ACWEPH_29705 [Nocardia beijingensis]
MTSPYIREIRLIADHVLAIPECFTPHHVSSACAMEFSAVPCANPHASEFVAYPDGGPFSSIVFRGPRTGAVGSHALVIMHVARDVRITRADMAGNFELPMENTRVDPRIPPEGAVSFTSEHGARNLRIRFHARSQLLRDISVHESRGRARSLGSGSGSPE